MGRSRHLFNPLSPRKKELFTILFKPSIKLSEFQEESEKLYEQAQLMVRNAVIEAEPEIVEPINPEIPDEIK